MAGELATLAAEAMPLTAIAVSGYGTAGLAREIAAIVAEARPTVKPHPATLGVTASG
jgi:hypothetical protein